MFLKKKKLPNSHVEVATLLVASEQHNKTTSIPYPHKSKEKYKNN